MILLKFGACKSKTHKSMTFRELRKIVQEGEGLLTEFKLKALYPAKIMREIVAFANTKGGNLIIGVSDDLVISGLKHPEEDIFVLENAIKKLIKPLIAYELHRITLNDRKEVLVFNIKESTKKPVALLRAPQQRGREIYVRVADKSLQASPEMISVLMLSRKPKASLLSFGSAEQSLFAFLHQNQKITLKRFIEISNLAPEKASELLVKLTLAQVLQIIPQETGEDLFIRNPEDLQMLNTKK